MTVTRSSLPYFAVAIVATLMLAAYTSPALPQGFAGGGPAAEETPAQSGEPTAEGDSGEDEASAAAHKPEAKRYRLLPIPIFITEPAIGEGLGVALTLFHPVKQGKVADTTAATPGSIYRMADNREAPPVVTAVMAAYTTNDTWLAGIGHFNNWRNDSIRYAGGLAKARVNSRIYLANLPFSFSLEGAMLFQELKLRLGHSDFMIGGGLGWMDADARFGFKPPGDGEDNRFRTDIRNAGLELKLNYETRNNAMNPTRGQLAELGLWRYDSGLGGDFNYWSWNAKVLSFYPLSEKWTLGLRASLSGVDGSPPFFAYPYVSLRGIPALRYQDEVAGAAEAEIRYQLAPRWQISAFGGLGYVSDRVPLFDNPNSLYNFGVGGRYKVFDAHNVWMGIDAARGPEDWNYYVQVGHPW